MVSFEQQNFIELLKQCHLNNKTVFHYSSSVSYTLLLLSGKGHPQFVGVFSHLFFWDHHFLTQQMVLRKSELSGCAFWTCCLGFLSLEERNVKFRALHNSQRLTCQWLLSIKSLWKKESSKQHIIRDSRQMIVKIVTVILSTTTSNTL